jgi:hypothetical protein
MTVPRLVISAATMTANALLEDRGAGGVAVRRRGTASEGPLLPDCSQTVRILLDVPAHKRGKCAGQAHNAGHVCTSWDGLVGSNPGIPPAGGVISGGRSLVAASPAAASPGPGFCATFGRCCAERPLRVWVL